MGLKAHVFIFIRAIFSMCTPWLCRTCKYWYFPGQIWNCCSCGIMLLCCCKLYFALCGSSRHHPINTNQPLCSTSCFSICGRFPCVSLAFLLPHPFNRYIIICGVWRGSVHAACNSQWVHIFKLKMLLVLLKGCSCNFLRDTEGHFSCGAPE